jgi:hypothetical protein
MDTREFIDTRRKRYLGRTLIDFERRVETLLEGKPSAEVEAFKSAVRSTFQDFADDCTDVMLLTDVHVNAAAVEQLDRLRATA